MQPTIQLIDHLRDETEDFTRFSVAFGLELGIDQLPVRADLKPALIRRDQSDALDDMLIILQQFFCQAHGPAGVMSNRAINDLDLQHGNSPSDPPDLCHFFNSRASK